MKPKRGLGLMISCLSILSALQWSCPAEEGPYDFSSPEAAFRSCGLAIKNNDPEAYYNAIYIGEPLTYERFLNLVWEPRNDQGQRIYFLGSPVVWKSGHVADYFLGAEFLKEVEARRLERGEVRSWFVKWSAGKLIRKEGFVRFAPEGDWRWSPNLYSQDINYRDSFATPSDAFRTVGQAQFLRLEVEVCRGLASAVRGGPTVDQCAQTMRERLAKLSKTEVDDVWINPALTACVDCLEEEYFTEKDGRQMCRVWELRRDAHGKSTRHRYQLFVKEEEEWRWLPDSKSFWYMGKPQP